MFYYTARDVFLRSNQIKWDLLSLCLTGETLEWMQSVELRTKSALNFSNLIFLNYNITYDSPFILITYIVSWTQYSEIYI